MSQKKVDAYKARKGLHNKTDRKEKVLFGLEMFAWAFICVVIVAWIGYSAYVKVTGAKENVVQNTVMDTTALDNYISNLSQMHPMVQTALMQIQRRKKIQQLPLIQTVKMLMQQTQPQMILKRKPQINLKKQMIQM